MSTHATPRSDTESSLLIVIPAAEPAVAQHRARHDLAARVGVPAHVTVAYPFKPVERLTTADFGALSELFADTSPFELTFAATGWFADEVLFLDPTDPAPITALTRLVESAFPQYPIYGGAFDDVHPHLTVGHTTDDTTGHTTGDTTDHTPGYAVLRAIEREVRPHLPITHLVHTVELWTGPALKTQTPGWRRVHTFPLGE